MELSNRLQAFIQLGREINSLLLDNSSSPQREKLEAIFLKAQRSNGWFTRETLLQSFMGIVTLLEENKLRTWVEKYPSLENKTGKNIGVIMAGNIPAVGFHDWLCVLMSGNRITAKLSSDDQHLIPFISDVLISIEPGFKNQISFVERITQIDAVIATGSNNSSRYFEYYFSKYPHLFRGNRNAVAILTGHENTNELIELGKDVFSYFGLGCRNVSKLYIPLNYNLAKVFEAFEQFSDVLNHNKYMNNYDYNRTLLLLNSQPFLTNNFLIIKEDTSLHSPVSVLNYEYYNNPESLRHELEKRKNEIQCVVSGKGVIETAVPFGKTQSPNVDEYADGIDTMEFLTGLK